MGFLGGLGSLIGSVASSALGVHFNKKNMQNQSDIQTNQWQYQQSNAHQLEVEDLKAAGLNPILSAGSSQVVSQPSVSSSNSGPDIMGDMSRLLEANSAKSQADTAKTNAETERIKAETDQKRQKVEESKSSSDIKVNEETINKIKAETTSEAERVKLFKQQVENLKAEKENSARRTDAEVNQLNAAAYHYARMVDIEYKRQQAEERYKDSETEINKKELEYFNKESTKLRDQYEKEYLETPLGETLYKAGFGITSGLSGVSLRAGNAAIRK